MTDRNDKSSNSGGCVGKVLAIAALLTAIAAVLTAIGFPSFFPDLVNRIFPSTLQDGKPISPTQFIEDYYAKVDEKETREAWEMLTPRFRAEKERTYTKFYEWWNSVDQVQVQDAVIISHNRKTAIVEVRIAYVTSSGFKEENPLHLELIWNEKRKNWQINESSPVKI